MKKYRLKKELPGIPVGTEYEEGKNGFFYGMGPFNLGVKKLSYVGPDEMNSDWFPQWFEEVPDFSFVKDGDIYWDGVRNGAAYRFGRYYTFSSLDGTYGGKWIRSCYAPTEYGQVETSPHVQRAVKLKNLIYRSDVLDIMGWDKPAPCEGKEVEIDGKTYVLKEKKEGI